MTDYLKPCKRCGAPKWGPDHELCNYCLITKSAITALSADAAPEGGVLHRANLYELAATAARVDGTMDRIEAKVDELAKRYEWALAGLHHYKTEVRAILDRIPGELAVCVREGNGPENELASLAVSVAKLVREVEWLTEAAQDRDRFDV